MRPTSARRSRCSPRCRSRRSSRPRTSTTSTRCRSGTTHEGVDDFIFDHFGIEAPPRRPRRVGARSRERADAASQPVRIALVGKYVAARGRLPVGRRGAAPRRLPARRQDRDRLGRLRDARRRRAGAPSGSAAPTASSSPAASAAAASRARSAPRASRASADPVPRHLPGHADRGQRVRAPRRRHAGRQLDRVRHRDRVAGDRPAARAEGGLRPRRHDAPGRRPGQAARRHARARALRRGRHLRAPPPPLRGLDPPAQALEAAGLVVSGTSPDERLVEVIELPTTTRSSSPRSTTPSSSRARSARRRCSASSSARRWSAREAAAPERRRGPGRRGARVGGGVAARVRGRAPAAQRRCSPSCARSRARSAHERACADRVVAASCAALGLEVEEDDAAAETGAECRQPPRAHPRRARERTRAALRAPRHGAARRRRSSRSASTAAGSNAHEAILGADNKAAVGDDARARAPAARRGRRRSASSCSSPSARRTRSRAPRRSTSRGCARTSATSSTTPRRSARSSSPRRPTTALEADLPRHGRARRHPPGGRAQRDRRRGARRSPRCRSGASTRRRPRTSARSRGGAGGTNVVPERCTFEAEARSLDDARSRRSWPRWSTTATTPPTTRLRVRRRRIVERLFHGYRHGLGAPAVRRRRGGAARLRLRAEPHPQRRRLGRQRVRGRRPSRASTSPTAPSATTSRRARRRRALEGMLDVPFALLDEASRRRLSAARDAGAGTRSSRPRPPAGSEQRVARRRSPAADRAAGGSRRLARSARREAGDDVVVNTQAA